MKYLVGFIPRVEHHDRGTVVFIDHSPQINHRVRQRHLCCDKCIATTITLTHGHKQQQPTVSESAELHAPLNT